jgi:hypothetical protein
LVGTSIYYTMNVSMAEIENLIGAAVRAAMAAGVGGARDDTGGGARGGGGGHLDERHFRRVEKLTGPNWKEFAFQFKTAAGAANGKVRDVLDDIAKAGKDPDFDLIFNDSLDTWVGDDVKKLGAELYAVLSSMVSGDAMAVVRGVASGDGWDAWSRLFNRFDPRTPAKALMAMMAVMQPKKVKDVRDLANAMQDWEVKVKNLKVEHDIGLDGRIKIALMTSFLPSDLQDHIFQMTDTKMDFESMKDRIMTLAVNRASMSRPTPMEVDRVQASSWQEDHGEYEEGGWTEDWEKDGSEVEIDYVGESCRKCGGMGHYARECPTPKGKGKGDGGKGGGKAKGKGKYGERSFESGWKGGGKGNGKGKGKGFMGECWTCGEKGHRSNECTNQHVKTAAMEIGSVERDLNVGGVWAIAQVQAEEDDWQVVPRYRKPKKEKNICAVAGIQQGPEAAPWRPMGSGEITVDSAAEESVCPKAWGEAYQMRRPSRWLRFVNASGGQMGHYGEKTATFRAGGAEAVVSLGFQVSDVQKPLAAVWRIAEKGNIVQFGPKQEDNFIQNVESGKKINMIHKAGSYVIEADYVVQEPGFPRQART